MAPRYSLQLQLRIYEAQGWQGKADNPSEPVNTRYLTTMAPNHLTLEPPIPRTPTFHRYVSRSSYDSFWQRSWIVAIALSFLMVFFDRVGHVRCGVVIAEVVGIFLTAALIAEILGV
jgi:hypothetical protein